MSDHHDDCSYVEHLHLEAKVTELEVQLEEFARDRQNWKTLANAKGAELEKVTERVVELEKALLEGCEYAGMMAIRFKAEEDRHDALVFAAKWRAYVARQDDKVTISGITPGHEVRAEMGYAAHVTAQVSIEKALRLIIAMAGIPDAKDACRNIIQHADAVLKALQTTQEPQCTGLDGDINECPACSTSNEVKQDD